MAQRPARRTLLAFPVAQGTQVCLEFVLNADQAINRVSIGHAAFAAEPDRSSVLPGYRAGGAVLATLLKWAKMAASHALLGDLDPTEHVA